MRNNNDKKPLFNHEFENIILITFLIESNFFLKLLIGRYENSLNKEKHLVLLIAR